MATKLESYPEDHPFAIALCGIVRALRSEGTLIDVLADQAERVGVRFGSEAFDEAAEIAGQPYCRALDLYVDRDTKRRADSLHFSEAHLAWMP